MRAGALLLAVLAAGCASPGPVPADVLVSSFGLTREGFEPAPGEDFPVAAEIRNVGQEPADVRVVLVSVALGDARGSTGDAAAERELAGMDLHLEPGARETRELCARIASPGDFRLMLRVDGKPSDAETSVRVQEPAQSEAEASSGRHTTRLRPTCST